MIETRKIVLDASAILAVLQQERGAEKLTDELLDNSLASTVNLAEVQTKLVKKGLGPDEAWEHTLSPVGTAVVFTQEHAKLAGALLSSTQHLGLSLGDRSCLALAIALRADVYTTEKAWKHLKVGVQIHLLR